MRKQVTLDGVPAMAAASVAIDLLKDKEVKKAIGKGAQTAIETGSSIVKWFWISVGSVAGIALLVWGGKKLANVISETKEKLDENKRQKDNMQEAKDSRSITNELWFTNAVADLKSAMGGCESFNKWFVSYNCDKIRAILSELGNKYDWQYLCGKFGTIDKHGLADWLGCDGWSDRNSYNEILTNLQVAEKDKITDQGLVGLQTL